MRWLAERLVLSGGLTLLLATGARAQAAAPATANPWSLSLGLGEIYESNVNFLSGAGGEATGELSSLFSAGAGSTLVRPRGTVNFNGNVAQILYRRTTSLSHFTYDLGAGATYAVTRRLSWTLSDTVTSAYAQDTKLLTDAGVLLPKVNTFTNAASSGLSYALSRRSQIRWGLGTQRIAFATSQFTSGTSIFTSLGLTQQVGPSQTLGVSYEYNATTSGGTAGTIQALLGTYRQTIGQNITLSAGAGIRPYTLAATDRVPATSQVAPAGSVGLTAHLGHTQTLGVSYERAVEQAIGATGTHETQGVSTTYGLSVGSRLGLSVAGNYVRGTYPQIPDLRLDARVATVAARYRVVNNLGVTAAANYFLRNDTGALPSSSYSGSLSLAYRTVWR